MFRVGSHHDPSHRCFCSFDNWNHVVNSLSLSLSLSLTGILKVIGSVNKIMDKCDADGDGAISVDHDMDNTKETCLATCFKRRAFKGAFFPDCEL